ncbi:hypothetical protein P3L10_005774 [Capsicum annuum]
MRILMTLLKKITVYQDLVGGGVSRLLRIYGTWIYESCYFEQIIPFLEAVLKNGIVLEKIILTPFKDGISIYPMQHAGVIQKLLSFPRSSEAAVIVFSG